MARRPRSWLCACRSVQLAISAAQPRGRCLSLCLLDFSVLTRFLTYLESVPPLPRLPYMYLEKKKVHIVQFLLESGVDPNARNAEPQAWLFLPPGSHTHKFNRCRNCGKSEIIAGYQCILHKIPGRMRFETIKRTKKW